MNALRWTLVCASLLFPVGIVVAAGGGGGGTVPSCIEDTWNCTEWASCSPAGQQSRTCALTSDCFSVPNTPPAQTQSCIPPVSQSAPEEPKPVPAAVEQLPTALSPSPPRSTPQSTKPACVSSTWNCGDWSALYDARGLEHRSCVLVSECVASPTPSPSTARACTKLQCGNKDVLKDRIQCRLELASEGLRRELEIQYLPEGCRAMRDREEQEECIDRYRAFNACWEVPEGEKRL